MHRIHVTCLFWFVLVFSARTQDALEAAERKLVQKLEALREVNDPQKLTERNNAFKKELEKVFLMEGFFDYPFALLHSMGSIKSTDGMVRLFNWNMEDNEGNHTFGCYVAHYNKNKLIVTELTDNSIMLPPKPQDKLDHQNWYGALYYQIIPVKKGSKTLYTLIGWDGSTSFSDIKVIDALYFTGSSLHFGYPIFQNEEGKQNRIFFEYKDQTVMSLRYDESRKMIVYDHLSPESPSLKGVYAYYVPDMSYDAFNWDGKYWQHKSDVVAVNDTDRRKRTVIRNADGKVVKTIDNEWIDPTNGDSPIDNGKHVAVTPEDEDKAEKKTAEAKMEKSKNNKKNNPYYSHDKKKRKGKNKPGSAIGVQR